MRIIGGAFKGRRFEPPKNIPTRPTTDIAKEGLFNTLNNYYNFDNIRYLDLFSGTGSLCYEFASRGCTDITAVEIYPRCAAFIQKTADALGMEGFRLFKMDVFQFMESNKEQYDLIFAGPPYPLKTLPDIPDLIFEHNLVEGQGWFIMEHNPNHNFEEHPHYYMQKKYGSTIFSIFTNKVNEHAQ